MRGKSLLFAVNVHALVWVGSTYHLGMAALISAKQPLLQQDQRDAQAESMVGKAAWANHAMVFTRRSAPHSGWIVLR